MFKAIQKSKAKKGFTLVELIVVIAIIAILAVAGVVGYTVFTEKAKKSNAESELSQVKTLIQAEDFENPYFDIENGALTIGYATDATDKTTWITKAAYDELADKTGYSALTLTQIFAKSDDTELKAVADKISYDDGKIIMTSTSDAKYEAAWNLANDSITGKKKS